MNRFILILAFALLVSCMPTSNAVEVGKCKFELPKSNAVEVLSVKGSKLKFKISYLVNNQPKQGFFSLSCSDKSFQDLSSVNFEKRGDLWFFLGGG